MTTYTILFIMALVVAMASRQIAKFVLWGSVARLVTWTCWGLAGLLFVGTSFTVIDQDSVGHLKRINVASDMRPGQIIALENEKGPQARILGPGFHLIPFVNILYQVEERPLVQIPDGSYGHLVARDGAPLAHGHYMAGKWNDSLAQIWRATQASPLQQICR